MTLSSDALPATGRDILRNERKVQDANCKLVETSELAEKPVFCIRTFLSRDSKDEFSMGWDLIRDLIRGGEGHVGQ